MKKRLNAGAMRAKGFLEIASGLYDSALPNLGVRLDLRLSGVSDLKNEIEFSCATGALLILEEVGQKKVDVGWINPAAGLAMAVRGKGPFAEPLPLRTLANFPSWDRLVFAVAERTGITSLAQVREEKYPLRISICVTGPTSDNPVIFTVEEVLRLHELSLEKIRECGGSLQLVRRPSSPERIAGIQDGSVDAVFDEGLKSWAQAAIANKMTFLQLDESVFTHMESLGFRRGVLSKVRVPNLRHEIVTLDFSGWPMYCHTNLNDEVAYSVCTAIESRRELIPVDQDTPLAIAQLCVDSELCPLVAPLHPGAERYYREMKHLH